MATSTFAEALIIICALNLSAVIARVIFEEYRGSDDIIRCLIYATGILSGAWLGGLSREQEIWTVGISGVSTILVFSVHAIIWTLRRHHARS